MKVTDLDLFLAQHTSAVKYPERKRFGCRHDFWYFPNLSLLGVKITVENSGLAASEAPSAAERRKPSGGILDLLHIDTRPPQRLSEWTQPRARTVRRILSVVKTAQPGSGAEESEIFSAPVEIRLNPWTAVEEAVFFFHLNPSPFEDGCAYELRLNRPRSGRTELVHPFRVLRHPAVLPSGFFSFVRGGFCKSAECTELYDVYRAVYPEDNAWGHTVFLDDPSDSGHRYACMVVDPQNLLPGGDVPEAFFVLKYQGGQSVRVRATFVKDAVSDPDGSVHSMLFAEEPLDTFRTGAVTVILELFGIPVRGFVCHRSEAAERCGAVGGAMFKAPGLL